MGKRRNTDPENDRTGQIERMLADDVILKEYREQVANLGRATESSDDPDEARDITLFAEMASCQTLTVCNSSVPDGPIFFGHGHEDGAKEMLFYDVLFVKDNALPPLADRRYKHIGSLYNSLSLVAPPGEKRVGLTETSLQNMFLRMSTSSSSRRFGPYSTRSWTTSDAHGDLPLVYLSNRAFTHTEDVQAGRIPYTPCNIPANVDSNGNMARIIKASKGTLCFTQENAIQVCDLTVPADAPSAVRFPGPDVIVSGQLVYVTFAVRGTISKPVLEDTNRRAGRNWLYTFKPTLRSVFILSKTGPMTIMRNSLRKSTRFSSTVTRMDEDLGNPTSHDISRDLKRLCIAKA